MLYWRNSCELDLCLEDKWLARHQLVWHQHTTCVKSVYHRDIPSRPSLQPSTPQGRARSQAVRRRRVRVQTQPKTKSLQAVSEATSLDAWVDVYSRLLCRQPVCFFVYCTREKSMWSVGVTFFWFTYTVVFKHSKGEAAVIEGLLSVRTIERLVHDKEVWNMMDNKYRYLISEQSRWTVQTLRASQGVILKGSKGMVWVGDQVSFEVTASSQVFHGCFVDHGLHRSSLGDVPRTWNPPLSQDMWPSVLFFTYDDVDKPSSRRRETEFLSFGPLLCPDLLKDSLW